MAELGPIEQQALALAGVAQSARIVDQIARHGSYPSEFLEHSVHSLFQFDAEDSAQVFGGVQGVRLGLDTLPQLLGRRPQDERREQVRYLFAMLYLERRFAARPEMMQVMHSRLQHTRFKAEHFAGHVNEVCHSLSGIYQDTLSTLKFRIKVTGAAQHLGDSANADLIRAMLLAGVRAAFLWQQTGGRRWQLLLRRQRLLEAADALSRTGGVV